MTHKDYVDLMAMWFSGDVSEVAKANDLLYASLVNDENDVMKKLAVSDIESKIDAVSNAVTQ